MAYINEYPPPGIKRASLLGDGGIACAAAPMRESLTKRGELVHNLEILSEISPLSGTGSCPFVGLKMGGEHFHILI